MPLTEVEPVPTTDFRWNYGSKQYKVQNRPFQLCFSNHMLIDEEGQRKEVRGEYVLCLLKTSRDIPEEELRLDPLSSTDILSLHYRINDYPFVVRIETKAPPPGWIVDKVKKDFPELILPGPEDPPLAWTFALQFTSEHARALQELFYAFKKRYEGSFPGLLKVASATDAKDVINEKSQGSLSLSNLRKKKKKKKKTLR
eukprot:NODE_650_length_688_cov_326.354724_g641_i0.p1 GENE.NODE_650_length_688_cov_326.354724_g641_i0~~NODE_650_length_688_cov_326.354724_g641_i0.p1  ORF type:complete len:228 (+),score=76.47 NODE_650_length_688_cov_326.354724_g641_i0:88-684(+)